MADWRFHFRLLQRLCSGIGVCHDIDGIAEAAASGMQGEATDLVHGWVLELKTRALESIEVGKEVLMHPTSFNADGKDRQKRRCLHLKCGQKYDGKDPAKDGR